MSQLRSEQPERSSPRAEERLFAAAVTGNGCSQVSLRIQDNWTRSRLLFDSTDMNCRRCQVLLLSSVVEGKVLVTFVGGRTGWDREQNLGNWPYGCAYLVEIHTHGMLTSLYEWQILMNAYYQ